MDSEAGSLLMILFCVREKEAKSSAPQKNVTVITEES